MRLNQVTLPALDITLSAEFYQRLGLVLIVDTPHYVRLMCPDGQATLSLERVDVLPEHTAIVIYFELDDLDHKVSELQRAGFVFSQEPTDQPWLWREAHLRDPSGNRLCLFRAGENRLNPPWRVT